MRKIGYGWLIDSLKLNVRPLAQYAEVSSSVNRRQDTADRILFPTGVSVTDTPVGHLEFALRHEGVNLEVIDAAFEKIEAANLTDRLRQAPNSEYIRRACFLWEWIKGAQLNAGVTVAAGYIDMFSADVYAVAANPVKAPTYRVNDNALGNRKFCPVVRKSSLGGMDAFYRLLAEEPKKFMSSTDAALYDRAVRYLYLSETRNSFAIEKETPTASKEEKFVKLLELIGAKDVVSEDWLVHLQNTAIQNVYGQEAAYRSKQNWLEDAQGHLTFIPPPPDALRELMEGWEQFVNDKAKGVDLATKIACTAFGFVYIHPFLDGNGRLHRFMIHHVLKQSGVLPEGIILPVSASIFKNIPEYLGVLTGFSKPATKLWEYRRAEEEPLIISSPGGRPYRYFDADREVVFMMETIETTILREIPSEMQYLVGYDTAFDEINRRIELPRPQVSAIIRMIQSNAGKLSAGKRKAFYQLSDEQIIEIENIVQQAFGMKKDNVPDDDVDNVRGSRPQ